MRTCGHVDMWTCGHVYMCTCGHVHVCACGHTHVWACDVNIPGGPSGTLSARRFSFLGDRQNVRVHMQARTHHAHTNAHGQTTYTCMKCITPVFKRRRTPLYEHMYMRIRSKMHMCIYAPVSYTHLTLPTNREV